MKFKSCVLGLCMAAITSPLLAALPEVELIRTAAPIATPSGVVVGGHITSDPIQDSDGDLLRGDLEVTFTLNATSANSYTVNGLTVTPGASETFVFNFDATGGRLNVPVSVNGSGSVSTDDYDLSIRVPGLIEWQVGRVGIYGSPRFVTSFFGPDDLVWLVVFDDTAGTGQGLGVVKFDLQGNEVDSFSLNNMFAPGDMAYEGVTPDGNVILASKHQSVILTPVGEVVSDYPFRIFEVQSDGTIYREAGSPSTFAQMRLGRLLPDGNQSISSHPLNSWHSTIYMGPWGVEVGSSNKLRHVDNDGMVTTYASGDQLWGSGTTDRMGGMQDGWIKVDKTTLFVNKDSQAKRLRQSRTQNPSAGFTITSNGEWVINYVEGSWLMAKSEVVRISPGGGSAKAVKVWCSESPTLRFGKRSELNGKLLLNCANSVQLLNLEAESKWAPWDDLVSLDDLMPESVSQGGRSVYWSPPSPLAPQGLYHRSDETWGLVVTKP